MTASPDAPTARAAHAARAGRLLSDAVPSAPDLEHGPRAAPNRWPYFEHRTLGERTDA